MLFSILFNKRSLLFCAIALILCCGALYFCAYIPHSRESTESKSLFIRNGDGLNVIALKLKQHDLIRSRHFFKWFSVLLGKRRSYKRGEYLIEGNVSVMDLVKILSEGKTILIPVTFPEGLRMDEMFTILRSSGYDNQGIYESLSRDPQFISKYIPSIPANSLEGFLFPDTYKFSKDSSELIILKTMVKTFFKRLPDQYDSMASHVGLTFYEAVILASIIEKETSVPDERNLISSVFHNRLKKPMPLQTDPTVIYGIKNFDGNLTKKQLRTNTPYNTYMNYGLPPTPIANPGLDSILAAVNPADTEFLYFVAKGDGTHEFSVNYKDHRFAVAKYQKRKNKEYRSF